MSTTASNWSSWMELGVEYQDSHIRIKSYRKILKEKDGKKTTEDVVKLELAGSMERELQSILGELRNRTLHDKNSLSEADLMLPCLTDRQKEIAKLRQKHSSEEVARMLNIDVKTVYGTYTQVLKKVGKYRINSSEKILVLLSPKEKIIYQMYEIEGKSRNEIAEYLNVSINTIKTILKRIKDKQRRVTKS